MGIHKRNLSRNVQSDKQGRIYIHFIFWPFYCGSSDIFRLKGNLHSEWQKVTIFEFRSKMMKKSMQELIRKHSQKLAKKNTAGENQMNFIKNSLDMHGQFSQFIKIWNGLSMAATRNIKIYDIIYLNYKIKINFIFVNIKVTLSLRCVLICLSIWFISLSPGHKLVYEIKI